MAVWLDRLGLFLQFISFWLIAPEVFGEARIQKFGKGLATFFSTSLFLVLSVGIIALAWSLAFREGMHWFHRASIALAFSSIILVPKLFLYHRFRKVWLPQLVELLSSDEHFRRALLLIGGVLLSIGVALQVLATF